MASWTTACRASNPPSANHKPSIGNLEHRLAVVDGQLPRPAQAMLLAQTVDGQFVLRADKS